MPNLPINKNVLVGVAIGFTFALLLSQLNVIHQFRVVQQQQQQQQQPRGQSDGPGDQHQAHLTPTQTLSELQTQAQGRQEHHQQHLTAGGLPGGQALSFGNDKHFHTDDTETAQRLAKEVRVLIWIMTSPSNLQEKASTVRDTWGKRVEKLLFFSSETNKDFPTVGLDTPEGRDHLTAKTMKGFKYVYDHHFQDADWFMKADDDTFVIIENLRYFLSNENHSDPVYFGHHFKTIVKQGYYSGGGGYVLSKEALRRLATEGSDPKVCRQDGGAEDAELGLCMEKLGVRTSDSNDALGRSRFHCFDPETHLFGGYPDWYFQYDSHGAKKGEESISDYAISFHYVPPKMMKTLEFYIYHLRPYGIKSGDQDLNVRQKH